MEKYSVSILFHKRTKRDATIPLGPHNIFGTCSWQIMTRYTKSWTLLGVLMCASSVEGLLDGPQHFPSFPGSHRALATPSPLSCVSAPALQRNPIDSALAFVAGFDLVSFTETIKDFAIGGVSGAIAQTIVFPIDLAKTKMQDEVPHSATASPMQCPEFQCILERPTLESG